MPVDEGQVALEKMWQGTCRVLFGQELGPLHEYEKWLSELVDPPFVGKSSKSSKEVFFSTQNYSNAKKCVGLEEVDLNQKFQPLSINQIKDIDSIAQAISDRAYYTGNVILGNSRYVSKSANITDGTYISNTTLSGNSKYLCYCTLARLDNAGFGGNAFSQCEFCLKCHELTRVKRSFELWMSQDSSDCYYSHGLKNCTDCMFSFNVRNKRFAVGNIMLAPDKYKEIKTKLVAEMAVEAKRAKRLPSLLEIVAISGKAPKIALAAKQPSPQVQDKGKIEAAFSQTMQILLGRKLAKPIDFYAQWLVRHTRGIGKFKSAMSGKDVLLAHYGNYSDLPKDRLLTLDEANEFGMKAQIDAAAVSDLSLKNAHMKIGNIAFFNSDIQDGVNMNDIECTITIDASLCYRAVCSVYSKYCAYSFWPRSCEYIFGCDTVFDSSFCVNCYNSVNLKRCFEVDSSNSCSDSYFCHNCENVQNSMFCFNVKNKRYAIGNVEVGQEAFMKAKAMLVAQMADTLDKNGKLSRDVFSL